MYVVQMLNGLEPWEPEKKVHEEVHNIARLLHKEATYPSGIKTPSIT